jgi:uncharacterized protein
MLFLLLPTLLVFAVHFYLWWRLVGDPRLPRAAALVATLAIALLGSSIPIAMRYLWAGSRGSGQLVVTVAFGWLGVLFYVMAVLVAWDGWRIARAGFRLLLRLRDRTRRLLARSADSATRERQGASAPASVRGEIPSRPSAAASAPERETRRVFVARAVAGTALAAGGGIGAFGVRSALWELTMPEVSVGLARLPRELDGFTIALLTDVHIGPLLDGRYLRQLAEQTNRARPDLIAIAGDLVDGTVARIGEQVAELRRLRARYGVCYVTGNHEYYTGAREWIEFLPKLGVRVLMNERISVGDAAASGAQLEIGGVPDRRAGRYEVGPDAAAAVRGRDPERELVMLAHQPAQIEQIAHVGAGLQLSGHTHGGQLYPFGVVGLIDQPYVAGLHRHEASETQVYVSRGTGFSGPPMRVLAPAEISLIRLHRV